MVGWIFPIGFWFIGLLIAASPGILFRTLESEKEKLRKEADETKDRDHSASILFIVEEKILSMINWWSFTLGTSIVAAFFITFGFVALSFVLTW
ncbi:hypothetical protein [Alkalihalobacillus sp. AL-G]|uniref:hypothetical protein n=1 Tax=Alkalihalobacillus sp. AL-G TaxID=2926399 RepID=UPI00272DA253|nr:hypothetical protein [Alkalihalobacillus sp. AL-G]WLD92755.1 hypothetical protein MOJ78_17355 [Alkalihalobacillus sp. AL-G]